MESKYIEDIFKDYLAIKKTNYALLINGSWGSGKTYFWKTVLADICIKTGFKPIYLSLNGINKIETLDYQLKIKLIPYLNKLEIKKAGALAKITKNIFNKIVEKYANFNPENILKDVEIDLAIFSNNIICFDDLERCKIQLPEVLGYINDYVEHKNLKVVFLSYEKENDNKYNSIKEKVIGRVLNFKNNLIDTLPLLFDEYKKTDNDFYKFLELRKNSIYDFLKEYEEENLRNISFYIYNLSKVYFALKLHDEYSNEIILFTLIITIEFKNGKLTSNDYQDFKGYDKLNSTYALYNFSKPRKKNFGLKSAEKEIEEPKSDLELFNEKYLKNNISKYFFYPSIYQFILTGYLNEQQLTDELKARYPEEIAVEVDVFRRLLNYNFREMSNDNFEKLSLEVYTYATEGKYGIYDYLQLSNFYNYFSENNLIDLSFQEIQEGLKKGIEISKKRKDSNNRLFESIFHFTNNNEDKVISKLIKEAHKIIEKEKELLKTNQLIISIEKNDIEAVNSIFKDYSVNKELFEQINLNDLFEQLLKSENKTINNFNHQIEGRYNFGNVKDFLSEDLIILKGLSDKIDGFLTDKNKYSLKQFLIKELSLKLKDICQKLV